MEVSLMLRLLFALSFFALLVPGRASDETDVIAVTEKLFKGMAAHDAVEIRSTMLPETKLYFLGEGSKPGSISGEDFINHIVAAKGDLNERYTAPANVRLRGRIAEVWGEYEFSRDGKFGHCGIDLFSLLKTAEGWKIAAITYTSETTGCPGQ